jgi:PilZ domain
MLPDRRRSQRFPSQQMVSIFLRNHGERECIAVANNVSTRGAFVQCDRYIAVGSEVVVILLLPREITHGESRGACCVSKVLRVSQESRQGKFGIAVAFQHYQMLSQV